MVFKKPKNPLEGMAKLARKVSHETIAELTTNCPNCNKTLGEHELLELRNVCPYCSWHFRINARQRIDFICDANSFEERDGDLISDNILEFPGYDRKLKNARLESAEKEAVVCGRAKISGNPVAVFVMEPYFMMGSMGRVVGEKITRLFEYAKEAGLPVIGFTVSGGARMQEGIISLMQMAKISGAVKLHSDANLLYLCVLTDPTTGGVSASFAMEADIIIAEPFALVGFAGPRVIEQTIRKKLPVGFQRAEFLLEKGFIDDIVHRKRLRSYLSLILRLHKKVKSSPLFAL